MVVREQRKSLATTNLGNLGSLTGLDPAEC